MVGLCLSVRCRWAAVERPGIGDCRAAARAVRSAEFADDVVGLLRPRTHGFFRTRAPVALQLFRASREGRLIWRGPNSVAVVQAPGDRAVEGSVRWLRHVDRQWSQLVLLGEFLAFVLSLLVLVALRGALGATTVLVCAYIAELLFLVFIAADQLTGLGRMIWRGLRSLARDTPRPDETAAESMPYEQWSMVLCHHGEPAGAAALLDEVKRRLTGLAGDNSVLACPTAAVTTTEMRDRVAAWADGLRTGVEWPAVSVLLPRRRPVRAPRVTETGAFFFVYLVLAALVVVSMASVVAGWERSACGDDCASRPATWATALEWARYRLVYRDPPGLHAATFWARSTGVMIGVFLPLTLVMAAGSVAHYRRYRMALRNEYLAMMDEAAGRDRILLVVATEAERKAVLERAGVAPSPDFSAGHPVYRLGVIGDVEVLLAQCGPGVTSPVSAAYSVPELIEEWHPQYVILLGICFGLREDEQRLGDVIVGRRLQVINLRVGEGETRDRGDAITAGHRLVERFAVAIPPAGVRVWQGTLLSWDVLVDNELLRAGLRARYPDALGGEMEGAAVYAGSVRAGIEWIVVKGICDWAHAKSDAAHGLAAANAAALVLDLIDARAFAHRQGVMRR
jgi:nucleoside phosphorylase